MRNLLIATALLTGCGSPPVMTQESCTTDEDCRNGFHCNTNFDLCEVNQEVDASRLRDDAAISVLEDDASMLPDAGSEIVDAFTAPGSDAPTSGRFAIDMNGIAGGAELPTSLGRFDQEFVIEAIVRPTTTVFDTDIGAIVVGRRANDNDLNVIYSRNGRGRFSFEVNGRILMADHDSPINEWYHVAGVFSNGTMMLYVNGILDGTMMTDQSVRWDVSPVGWFIGREGWGPRGVFEGQIDEVRIHSGLFEEIPTGTFAGHSGVVFMMDEGYGSDIRSSDSLYSGTVSGVTWTRR